MTHLKGMLLAGLATAATATALIAPATAQAASPAFERHMVFAISPVDLRGAISEFSRSTGVQLVAAPSAIQGRHTAGVSGTHSVRDALAILLQGTGLTATIRGNLAMIQPAPPAPSRAPRKPHDKPDPVVMAEPAAANEAAEIGPDIIVSGYRDSLRKATDLKRRAVGSEDDILAQDIAAFPDLNLAEALQRVPGITITRDSGEGRQVTLRGLGPDFTRTQLNGMEVLTNTASGMDNRGGVSRSRSFDYSLFASELFTHVSVQKSYAAEQDEGGIAGTIQLNTARPFDYPGAKAVMSVKGQTNTNTSGVTPRMVALLSNHSDVFGALVSVAYSEIKSNEYGYRNWGWAQSHYNAANVGPNIDAATAAALEATGNNRIWAPTAQSPSSWYNDRKRFGVTGALQYHPSDNFHLDLDGLYGRLTDHRDDYALASAGTNALTGDVTGTQVIQSAVLQGNSLVAASYTGVDLRSEHHIIQNSTDFYQGTLHGTWKPTDRLTVTGLAGFEQSNFKQPVFDKVFLESKNQAFSFDDRPTVPVNTYGFDVSNPANFQLMRLDTQENTITNKYANGKLDVAYKLSPTSTIKFGGSFKHFTDSAYGYSNKVFYNAKGDTVIPDALKGVVGVDSLYPYVAGNVDGTYAYIGQTRDLNASYLIAGSDYRVDEKTWSGYAQYDLDTYLLGMRARANAGVRYYSTTLVSSGHLATTAGFTAVSVENTTHGWLPAANIAVNVTDKFIVRLSANRNVNRPGLSDLAAAGTLTTAPFGGTLTVGNPNLKPYKATSIEGAFEYYFNHAGYVSLDFFYKKMGSFITTQTSSVPYSATGYPLSLLLPGQGGDTPYTYSRPVNGPGADIKGIEAAVQHDFDFLPAPFNHFGVNANGTYFDGHQSVLFLNGTVQIIQKLPLFNLSKFAANATLYYETDKWGVRVSEAYRSHYLTGAGVLGNVGDGIKGTRNLDAQAHLNLNSRLRLVVQGINLTNQPIVQYINGNRIEVYTKSGRTFSFGVTAEF
jgi:iron complex outermembrane receptor protein